MVLREESDVEITAETKLRVCRSVKMGDTYSVPEWYLTTNFKNIQAVLGLKHREAVTRLKRELAEGPLCCLYQNGVCYGIGLEEGRGENGQEGRIQVPAEGSGDGSNV